jgi:hypothetical protein
MAIEVQLNGRKSARKKIPGVGGFLCAKMLLPFLG